MLARYNAFAVVVAMPALILGASAVGGAQEAALWQTFYDTTTGFGVPPDAAWMGEGTSSEQVAEGLRIVDASTKPGSGRLYILGWNADPAQGATVEARLKLIAASEPWGACINITDGVHEEDVSFLPDRVVLSYAKTEAKFATTDGFHTYRIVFKGTDIQVWADDVSLIDGKGKFTQPIIEEQRNRLAFGASASTATSESVWQFVRFQGGNIPASGITPPNVPGLEVKQLETVTIADGVSYSSMFRFASGALQAAGKRSTDGGKTWAAAGGPPVTACQLPDGEVLLLDYRTHAAADKGWFDSALTRWDAAGTPLPALRARLHVPDFVTTVDDDGSKRDGPWCDHSVIILRDGTLLAANSGCFAQDKTPVGSYPTEFGAKKYRGFVTRSTDRGLTWEYLATVTADPTLGTEGCNEMDLVRAPNGDLLCLFRTGGHASHPSPLFQCRSTDEGKTWGAPERVADRGVWPNCAVTSEGVIVCTYGRPGNWLTFSLDSGRTWVGHFCFDAARSTSYNSIEEVSPGRLLVMHDRQALDAGGNPHPGTVGTFFGVKRTAR